VFKKDKDMLFKDHSIFNRIFKLYRSFCIHIFFKKSITNIPTNDGVLIFLWNNVMADILKINIREYSLSKVMHMFFMVQQCLTSSVVDFTMKNIINKESLIMDKETKSLKYEFKMIDQNDSTLMRLFQENVYLLGGDQQIMCMEIAYSFLRLINKATKHMYYGDMLRIAQTAFCNIDTDDSELQHDCLFKFREGITIRVEIARFYRNFFVFHNNHLVSPNEYNYYKGNQEYDGERLVTLSHVKEDGIVHYILEMIKSSVAIPDVFQEMDMDDADGFVTEFFIKNFFTMIYKYLMGVYKLYHYDSYHRVMEKIVQEIGKRLCRYT
jgi:hypothetical protein